jgi:hypothetical protein
MFFSIILLVHFYVIVNVKIIKFNKIYFMQKEVLVLMTAIMFVMISQFSLCQTKEKIDKATNNGKVVFLVVADGNNQLSEANQIAVNTQKKVKKSEVITLDVSDKSNEDLISQYRLNGAQTPLILVIASNGVVAGGFNLQATPENLIEAIPTKKQADALLAFSQGKSVFIVLSKKAWADKAQSIDECNKSCIALKNKSVVIDLDMDDKAETSFLKILKPDFNATKTNVLVFNSKGQFTEKLEAPVKSGTLTSSTKKKVGGCCPPGVTNTSGCGKK